MRQKLEPCHFDATYIVLLEVKLLVGSHLVYL